MSLKKPFKPLSSGTIATITSNVMKSFDISPKLWGAHSTRGAGVAFYRRLGLSAEEVCEIGKWKDVNAFTTHYQRLDAHHKALRVYIIWCTIPHNGEVRSQRGPHVCSQWNIVTTNESMNTIYFVVEGQN